MVAQEFRAGVQAGEGAEGRGEEGLVDVAGAGDGVDAVVSRRRRDLCRRRRLLHFVLSYPLPVRDDVSSLRREAALEVLGSPGAEAVAAAEDVGAVGVADRVEGREEGEHFGGVAAAAEDEEEVRWGAAFAGGRGAAVEGGEDVDEAELDKGGVVLVSGEWFGV